MIYKLTEESGKNSKIDFHLVGELRWKGENFPTIAERFGVTRQRVEQVCKKFGFTKAPFHTVPDFYAKYRWRILNWTTKQPNGCWEWTKGTSKEGYGRMSFMGGSTYAHRVSYTVMKGTIPEGLFILHSCNNPKCVNPDHLRPGTQQENVDDRELAKKLRQNK